MSVNSNVVPITVTNSGGNNCNCPTSEVCANSNGTCPSGTFSDNYNIGCCIPCSQLIPYTITDVNVENVNVYAYVNVNDMSVHVSGINSYYNCQTKNQTFSFYVAGKLVDSDGHGICNAQINAYNDTNLVTVVTYNTASVVFPSNTIVTWVFGIGSGYGYTNDSGYFVIKLDVTNIQVQDITPPNVLDPGCYMSSGPNIVPFLVTIKVPNTTITTQAPGQLVFYSSISKPL